MRITRQNQNLTTWEIQSTITKVPTLGKIAIENMYTLPYIYIYIRRTP